MAYGVILGQKPDLSGYLPLTGGGISGDLTIGGQLQVGKIGLRTDNEGGNLWLNSPDSQNRRWEIDANNGNLRIFTQNFSQEDYHEAIINYANGDVLSGAGGSITTNYHFTPQFGATNQVADSLLVNTSANFNTNYMYSGYVDSNNLMNNPLGAGSNFAGIRRVYVDGLRRIMVEIIETYPVPGRHWYCCYTQGSGWSNVWYSTDPSKAIADQGISGIWKYTRYADNYKVCFATTAVNYVNGHFCVGTFTLPFTISNGTALASVGNVEYSDIAISQLMAAAIMINNNQVRVIIGNGAGGFSVGTVQLANIVVAGF